MNDYDLADTIIDAMADMSERVVHHYDHQGLENAWAIISEWTLPSNDCVLTKFITDNTHSIKEELLYCTIEDDSITYGTFTFEETSELPLDNQ